MSKETLAKAVDKAGGQVALANGIARIMPGSKVRQGHVWKWLNLSKEEVPPAEYCRAIEDLTGVTRYELRPDVFGQAPESKPMQEAA